MCFVDHLYFFGTIPAAYLLLFCLLTIGGRSIFYRLEEFFWHCWSLFVLLGCMHDLCCTWIMFCVLVSFFAKFFDNMSPNMLRAVFFCP